MTKLPFFPLAIEAYLADCGHLTDAEHGRYLRLLMEMWRAPQQRLPNDDAWLARRFSRTVEAVRAELRPLIQEFCQCDGNWISSKRLSQEWKYVTATRNRQSVRSKSRWDKEKTASINDAALHASGNALTLTQDKTESERVPKKEHDVPSLNLVPEPVSEADFQAALIFKRCLPWLVETSGRPDHHCRSLLGKWRKQHGDELLLAVLNDAQVARPLDAVGWIEGAFRQRHPPKPVLRFQ